MLAKYNVKHYQYQAATSPCIDVSGIIILDSRHF